MLDQLVKLVEQNAGNAIVKNDAIPNQFNNAAIKEVAGGIVDNLKNQVSQGNIQQVISMFQSGGSTSSLASNPIVKQIITSLVGNFASKFGISSAQAQSAVSGLVPLVISQFVTKAKDPKDKSFDLTDVIGSLGGSNSGLDVGSIIGQLAGGNAKSNPLGALGGLAGKLFGK